MVVFYGFLTSGKSRRGRSVPAGSILATVAPIVRLYFSQFSMPLVSATGLFGAPILRQPYNSHQESACTSRSNRVAHTSASYGQCLRKGPMAAQLIGSTGAPRTTSNADHLFGSQVSLSNLRLTGAADVRCCHELLPSQYLNSH